LRFRLSDEFRGEEILKAPSGKKYGSLDARCRACVVKGGTEKRCHPWRGFKQKNPHGYACPRREWPDGESADLALLASLGAQERGHLFLKRWELSLGHLSREEQARLFDRMLAAYNDEAISSVYWPKVN
jgi:hypothetical protein